MQRIKLLSKYASNVQLLTNSPTPLADHTLHPAHTKNVDQLEFSSSRELLLVDTLTDAIDTPALINKLIPRLLRGAHIAVLGYSTRLDGDFIARLNGAREVSRTTSGHQTVSLLRPLAPNPATKPSLSILVPAKNEKGNIQTLFKQLPSMNDVDLELVFIEGGSSDGTWDAIQQQCDNYQGSITLKCVQQPGRGKANAVDLGVESATKELVIVLDADLTVAPSELEKFHTAYCAGAGDFINGDRLSLPMEKRAMRPLNFVGNHFFAWSLSRLLRTRLPDTLCGTKLFPREDYFRMRQWCIDLGLQDPFGDFSLLMSASSLGLGIANVPIAYKARRYGTTQIRRFRDGMKLLTMCRTARNQRFQGARWPSR